MTLLKVFLKDAEERVRQTAVKELNRSVHELVGDIKNNMNSVGIHEKTGNLRGSIKAKEATLSNFRAVVISEVYAVNPKTQQKVMVKRPGIRNPAMKNRYKKGVPYGRIIEFSKKINKPFFYKSWYENRDEIKENLMKSIGKAWSK